MALRYRLTDDQHKQLSTERMSWYVRDGDGWRLDLDPEDDVAAMKAAHERDKAELRELKAAKRHRDEVFGTSDVTEQARLMAEAEATLANGMSETEFQKALVDLKTESDAALAARDAEYEAKLAPLRAKLLEQQTSAEVNRAMIAAGVADLHLLAPHVLERVRAEPTGDKTISLTVLDAEGAVRTHEDGSPVSLGEMLREWQFTDPSLSRAYHDPVAWRIATAGSTRNGNGAY